MSKAFKEGDIVTFQGHTRAEDAKQPTVGTIFMIHCGEALAIDAKGFLHRVKLSEMYHNQGEVP